MVDYLILTEKAQAAKQFEAALGSNAGSFNGKTFRIIHAAGHLLKIPDPQYLVNEPVKAKYETWSLDNLPWKRQEMNFHYVPSSARNRSLLKDIKTAAGDANSIVIATDDDPSGEGESIAWEIINYIGWQGKVYREYHDDLSAKSIKKALSHLKDVSDPDHDGDLQKSIARQQWDYLSQQFSRYATLYVRQAHGQVKLVPLGRLKSVIVDLVAKRLAERKNYVKKPYYEVGFQDENGHWYLRKKPTDKTELAKLRHANKAGAESELQSYSPSPVVEIKRTLKHQAPGKLIDLSRLDGILSRKGYTSKMIQSVYQKLYLANYVSYPRTEDKFVTEDQFNELLQNTIRLAQLVNIDPSKLTYRMARPKLVKSSATHGANRPGSKIPQNLDELAEVVKPNEVECAKDIYRVVTKSALTMFAPDYTYEKVVGQVQNSPSFTTTIDLPKEMGWKAIFNEDKKTESVKPLGNQATPKIKEGANPKPGIPTKAWLYHKLASYGEHGVGTAATQQSTVATITDKRSSKYLLTSTKGKLGLSPIGQVSAIMTDQCLIASPQVTIKLFNLMDDVGDRKKPISWVVDTIDQVVSHDVPLLKKNAQKVVDDQVVAQQKNYSDNRVAIEWEGQTWEVKKSFGKHKFSNDEWQKLINGEPISFPYKNNTMTGKLAVQDYNGHQFLGFKPEFNNDSSKSRTEYETVEWQGNTKQFKKIWGSHHFSNDELTQLKAGHSISFAYKGKTITGKLGMNEFKGRKFFGFKPDFD